MILFQMNQLIISKWNIVRKKKNCVIVRLCVCEPNNYKPKDFHFIMARFPSKWSKVGIMHVSLYCWKILVGKY